MTDYDEETNEASLLWLDRLGVALVLLSAALVLLTVAAQIGIWLGKVL